MNTSLSAREVAMRLKQLFCFIDNGEGLVIYIKLEYVWGFGIESMTCVLNDPTMPSRLRIRFSL